MSKIICKVEQDGEVYYIEAASGMRLLDVINMHEEVHIDAPCGGNGTCGKCKVKVIQSSQGTGLNVPNGAEHTFLSPKEIEEGVRLSCRAIINGDCHIVLLNDKEKADILSDSTEFQGELHPPVEKTFLELPEPSIEDQRPDDQRVVDELTLKLKGNSNNKVNSFSALPQHERSLSISMKLRKTLPQLLRESQFQITVTHDKNRIYKFEKGNTEALHFGIGIDIGTTTVVAYLVDLKKGRVIDTVSGLNRQKAFGGDVITRIEYVMREKTGLSQIQERICRQLETLISMLLEKNKIESTNISVLSIAGNTTMMHLCVGLNPEAIAVAPFIPVSTAAEIVQAEELHIDSLECPVLLLPSLSGYVGADVSAGIISSGILEHQKLNLLVDFGTNGEIVLGNRDVVYTCSTAAGPAFEGAHISRGMGGVTGAINSVYLVENRLFYTTIGGTKPRGICGSGIFDVAALLISTGAADYTGRILKPEESETAEGRTLLQNYREENGEPALLLASAHETQTGKDVLFTQKDLREVQLAKAAIAAGIDALIHEAGITYDEVNAIYIAGGFGNYIDKHSAVKIGLFPKERLGSIESIGNSAGKGAVLSILSSEVSKDFERIPQISRYIELSSSAYFQNAYIEQMYFPMIE